MQSKEVAYLGPVGTYSHLVAQKRFGRNSTLIPQTTVHDICLYVSRKSSRYGLVPIENSSGGAIYETVDILMANKPKVHIEEEVTLNVKLALLGRKNEKIQKLYSHFAPLEHCDSWIRKTLPGIQKQVVTSTAVAALRAASETNGAALGNRKLASYYHLDILKYPVETDVPNITTFLVIRGNNRKTIKPDKTTVAARLPNKPGALCSFLEIFRDENVNLSRLISRPIRGCHRQYAFLVDLDGGMNLSNVKRAITAAGKTCDELRVVGSFPTGRKYNS